MAVLYFNCLVQRLVESSLVYRVLAFGGQGVVDASGEGF